MSNATAEEPKIVSYETTGQDDMAGQGDAKQDEPKQREVPEDRPPTHAEDPILTLTDAAKQLGKHRMTLARWVNEGIVNAGKHPNGAPGIRQSQVDKMLREFPV